MTCYGSSTAKPAEDFKSPAVSGSTRTRETSTVAVVKATSFAVELMEIYGIPDDLDLNWVRSFLRPLHHQALA